MSERPPGRSMPSDDGCLIMRSISSPSSVLKRKITTPPAPPEQGAAKPLDQVEATASADDMPFSDTSREAKSERVDVVPRTFGATSFHPVATADISCFSSESDMMLYFCCSCDTGRGSSILRCQLTVILDDAANTDLYRTIDWMIQTQD